MFEITRGYKKGRAVMFYDLLNPIEGKTNSMVPKDEVVTLCEDGKISNAKIQWWEGKPIVRVQTRELPLVKVDDNGTIVGTAHQAIRGNSANNSTIKRDTQPILDVSSKAKVVGKLSKRKPKVNISYGGYNTEYIIEKQELHSKINYNNLETIGDLFDKIANEFGIKQSEVYKAEFNKKVNINKKIESISNSMLLAIQSSMATYLMNMAHNEINQVYIKYKA